jgi:hypothetical protein
MRLAGPVAVGDADGKLDHLVVEVGDAIPGEVLWAGIELGSSVGFLEEELAIREL